MKRGDPVLELARSIRAYLPELVGEDSAVLDATLARLLAESRHDDVGPAILTELRRRPATHDWASRFLETGEPPVPQAGEKGLSPLPGGGEVVRASRFVCPEGDYAWYRRGIGEGVPACPTHGVPLRREARTVC